MWDLIADVLKAVVKWIANRRVSRQEKLMLVRSLPSGEIYLVETDQRGKFVRPGDSSQDQHYFDQRDRAVQEKSIETLQALITRGWVRHDTGILHRLTSTGFERARAFEKKIKL